MNGAHGGTEARMFGHVGPVHCSVPPCLCVMKVDRLMYEHPSGLFPIFHLA